MEELLSRIEISFIRVVGHPALSPWHSYPYYSTGHLLLVKSDGVYIYIGERGDITFFVLSRPPPPPSRCTSTPSSFPVARSQPTLFSRWVKSFTRDITPHPPFTVPRIPLSPHPPTTPSTASLFLVILSLRLVPSLPSFLWRYIYIYVYSSHLPLTRFSPHFQGEGGEHNIITISKSRFLMSSCTGDVMHLPVQFVWRSSFSFKEEEEEEEERERERVLVGEVFFPFFLSFFFLFSFFAVERFHSRCHSHQYSNSEIAWDWLIILAVYMVH